MAVFAKEQARAKLARIDKWLQKRADERKQNKAVR